LNFDPPGSFVTFIALRRTGDQAERGAEALNPERAHLDALLEEFSEFCQSAL
jgi:hypothetical protein